MRRICGLAVAATGVALVLGQSTGHAQFLRAAPGLRVSAAAASKTFVDPIDAQPGAAEITTVVFSNDDAGRFEVRVTLANRADLTDLDFVSVYLETDGNVATGCEPGQLGVDYIVGVTGHTMPTSDSAQLLRCIRGKGDAFTPQRSFTGEYDSSSSTVVFRFGCAEIGRPHSLRLLVVASHGDPQSDPSSIAYDFAGLEPWLYDVVPPCGPDTSRPRIAALPSVGVHGGTAKLTYRVADDSGYTKESFSVFRGKHRLAHTVSKYFQDADEAHTYYASWPVPKRVPKNLRFCVSAIDEAKNRSGTSCATVKIR